MGRQQCCACLVLLQEQGVAPHVTSAVSPAGGRPRCALRVEHALEDAEAEAGLECAVDEARPHQRLAEEEGKALRLRQRPVLGGGLPPCLPLADLLLDLSLPAFCIEAPGHHAKRGIQEAAAAASLLAALQALRPHAAEGAEDAVQLPEVALQTRQLAMAQSDEAGSLFGEELRSPVRHRAWQHDARDPPLDAAHRRLVPPAPVLRPEHKDRCLLAHRSAHHPAACDEDAFHAGDSLQLPVVRWEAIVQKLLAFVLGFTVEEEGKQGAASFQAGCLGGLDAAGRLAMAGGLAGLARRSHFGFVLRPEGA
mmetsp:Transcript_46868/g.139918  ORF Transcript_46868/g.139918 Transcript_46868/m.139918 type:complete len:309 (+) Transcript_46868:389-1315(+)